MKIFKPEFSRWSYISSVARNERIREREELGKEMRRRGKEEE